MIDQRESLIDVPRENMIEQSGIRSHHAGHANSVSPDTDGDPGAGSMSTGRYPAHGIPVRPRIHRAGCPAVALFFPEAVELRLRKISRGLPQDVVAASQFTNFPFQLFEAFAFGGGQPAITTTGVPFMLTEPGAQGSVLQPILGAREWIAACSERYSPRCSSNILTARSRNSGE